uniref:Outer membrane protein n=1 Tax=uncultured Helicobacter sp. TaxID=175537 RepID=A0A650EKY3_9HELI|nr:hypothetical protein Helico6505_0680 [uncultured Helicobacter sp.]
MYEGFFNVGYNLATQNYPLYLKLEYAYGTFAEEIQDNATALRTSLHQIGGVLHGFIHTQGKMTYEYALGYYYVFYGYHYFYPNNQDSGIRSRINDYTYALKAHIGFTYNFTERFGVFMNLKARYYDIAKSHRNATFDYPKAQNLVGMLELGLQF